ncbi:N-acetylglucosaminyl transferase component-domain-containing protein [Mycena sanguinolenta]|nr:N-acetylglucosaminyl transferase component-domain-containing protein [Mycena sanguinolenta]
MPLTVFWPDDERGSGFCYGWTHPVLCVAGVMQQPSAQEAENALTSLDKVPDWTRLSLSWGGKPVIIGKCSFNQADRHENPSLELNGLTSDYTIIYYHRHAAPSLRFYSLENVQPDAEVSASQKARNAAFTASLQHDFSRTTRHSGGINGVVINQFNAAKTVSILLKPKQPRRLPAELSNWLFDIMDVSLYIPQKALSLVRPPSSLSSLKYLSSTIQQLDVRAKQAEFLTHEVAPLRQRDLTAIPVYSSRYTNFFNTVWLILNDITIGVAFGSFLCENNIVLAQMLNHLIEVFLVEWVQWVLHWLDSWPAGLKLNTELSHFYAHTFSGLVAIWGYVLHRGCPYLPGLLFTCGVLSTSGMTTAVALFSDLLAFITLHIYVCYFLSRILYALLLRTGGSLWNLFRGKRFNVLRNRTDTWEYDTDQLLFGTILFTLLAFLFPTVLAYYALFAMLRLGVILVNAALDTQLAFMNHFPLFSLMLRAKDPWRLPGGIYFGVENVPDPVLVVKNQPVPFSTIFVQYIRLWNRLAAHYNPLRLLWYVLRGERLVAIPREAMHYFI